MQPYYVFFVTAYDSENRELGQYLGAVGIEIVQAHPNHHAALDEARRLVPWKAQFVIQRVVQKVPDLEEQQPTHWPAAAIGVDRLAGAIGANHAAPNLLPSGDA